MTNILFICTGNTCRSPMAESMLRHMAKTRGVSIEVQSAGVSAWEGTPMSEHAKQVLKDRQMGNEAFRSQALSGQAVSWADLILTLTLGHKQHVLQRFPEASDKTFTLKEYVHVDEDQHNIQGALNALVTELQLKLALGEQPTTEEMEELHRLQLQLPDMDIGDPYGGTLQQYKQTAEEIEEALSQLLRRLSEK
ncbi:low molecular weight protein arginine phosphatase [Paenibacillus sp. 1001270B_150601_E10]|uniref:low molecular weight protein arginine phosphatase n=1 Tax=Paenibacillus sp. 1001270B_150601_E10 TaxID=2787079 RepID=UPI00189E0664|nr:low molecular weight protein arginine phosphatase [Paenibacillus sp. 1001270B_150601_E10]